MVNEQDLRVKRTRSHIRAAFLDLIKENGYEGITIQQIADYAFINRATFYLHYKDKDELLETLSEDVFTRLSNAIKPCKYIEQKKVRVAAFQSTITAIFLEIERNKKFYKVMLSENGVKGFRDSLQKIIREKFENEFNSYGFNKDQSSVSTGLLTVFISSALVGTIKWWLEENDSKSAEGISKECVKICISGSIKAAGFQIIEK